MAGIEEAFEKFSDRLAREESKRYSKDEQGDYREYLSEEQDQYPIKLGPLQLGANANMSTGKFSPNEYQNVSTMNRNVGLRGRYDVPDSGIALLGSIGDVRSNQNVRTNLPFNPMTGEASPYSEIRKDVYKDSPYSVGAQYNPQGTDEMYSALYNKGGGYNLGYNKGPVNVSYTSNPGLGNNVMLRGQYNFADGGVASMFRERPGYQMGGVTPQLNPFASREETLEEAIARGEIFYNPITGIEVNPLTGMDVSGGRVLQSILDSQQQFMQQPQQSQTPQIQSPQLSYNEIQKANYARRMGELENKFANQGTSSTKYIQDMTNLLAQMKTSGGIDPLGAMQSKYYTGPSSGSVSEGRGIDANFVINRAQQSERDAAARVTPTRMAEGGRVGYAFGGMMKQALSQIGDQLAEKLPPEQQEAIVKANQSGGGIGSIFRSIISRVADAVKNKSTATPAAGLAIKLDRPVQSGDPIGSYYANPNNPALSSIAPPTTNPLTRPLSTAGFYGSEIFDILKRLGFNFADGGRVSMSEGGLTTTVPPAKGPDSQGVESLFRRRYS